MKQFDSGAIRSSDADATRYDLITPIGLRRLAETCKEGCHYGERNWEKGMPVSDLMNHLIKHIYSWLGGDRSEDHLAHAAWGLFACMHFEELNPECVDTPGGAAYVGPTSNTAELLHDQVSSGAEEVLGAESSADRRPASGQPEEPVEPATVTLR